jgi:hypothetical protein
MNLLVLSVLRSLLVLIFRSHSKVLHQRMQQREQANHDNNRTARKGQFLQFTAAHIALQESTAFYEQHRQANYGKSQANAEYKYMQQTIVHLVSGNTQ